jgi:hypothetical protein
MAGTYAATMSLMFSKTNVEAGVASMVLTGDAGEVHHDTIQEIGTSEEAIGLGFAGAGGWMYLQNLDDTNYIEIRANTGVADLIKLLPGQFAVFPTAADAVPYAIANTAACDMRVVVFEAPA